MKLLLSNHYEYYAIYKQVTFHIQIILIIAVGFIIHLMAYFLSIVTASLFMAPSCYNHANINIFHSMPNPNVVIQHIRTIQLPLSIIEATCTPCCPKTRLPLRSTLKYSKEIGKFFDSLNERTMYIWELCQFKAYFCTFLIWQIKMLLQILRWYIKYN